jgi:hypothetical protein
VNISKFDVGMLFSMTLAVILISFTGPVFGLTSANATDHQDIPNLSIGQNTFDVAGEFPEQPGAPSQGELVDTENESGGFGINQLFVSGSAQGDNDGIELVVINGGTSADPEAQVLVNDWNSGNVVSTTEFNLSSEGDTAIYNNDTTAFRIDFEATNITNNSGSGNTQVAVQYDIVQTPSDTGIVNNLPIIGGIASGASDLAGTLGWIGSVVFYLFLVLGETILNVITVLVDVTVYLISMVGWMFATYLGVIENAGGWARVIVAVPGTLFAAILAKFVAVGISMLPTT